MPTPGTYPSTTTISFSQINTEFGLGTPSPMNLNYRFTTPQYTPVANPIPTTPGPSTPASLATFPMDILHGRTKSTAPVPLTPFVTTFTTSGSWTATGTGNIKVLVVGGGGAGGSRPSPIVASGGGGGGGGVVYCTSFPVITGVVYPYTIGSGGLGAPTTNPTSGGNSNFNGSIIAIGGGRGGFLPSGGSPGGSGGGSGGGVPSPGTGTQPAQPQPPNCTNYGNRGGARGGPGPTNPIQWGGGGGGAGTVGGVAPGPGGDGIAISITGSPVYYGAGGGGAAYSIGGGSVRPGGLGGGGSGSFYITTSPSPPPATPGTFYGAGGGGGTISTATQGGDGYPGCVIIAYP